MIIASRAPAIPPDTSNAASTSTQQNDADRGHFDDVLASVGNGTPQRMPTKDAQQDNAPASSKPTSSAPRSPTAEGAGLADMLSRAAKPSKAASTIADQIAAGASGATGGAAPKKAAAADATAAAPDGKPTAAAPGSLVDALGATLSLVYAANASAGGAAANGSASRDETRTKKGDDGATPAPDDGLAASALAGALPNAAGTIAISHIAVTTQIAPHANAPALPDAVAPKITPVPQHALGGPASAPASEPAEAKASVESVAAQPATAVGASVTQPGLPPVATSVARAVIALAAQDGAQAASPASMPEQAAPAPARTLTLQLSPSNLGTVAIRLHLTGSSLDIDLTVSDPQTLGLISREHDALAGALRDQNYDLTSLVIQGAPASEPSTNGDAPSRNFTSREDTPDDDRSHHGGNADNQDQPAASSRGRDDRPSRDGSSGSGSGGSLFI